MKPTKPQLKFIKKVYKRTNNLPIGVAVPKAMAKRLVDKGLAKWTSPIWGYLSLNKNKCSSISLTVTGTLYAEDILV